MLSLDQFSRLPEGPESTEEAILSVLRAYSDKALSEKEIACPFGYLLDDVLSDEDHLFLKKMDKLIRDGLVVRRFLGEIPHFAIPPGNNEDTAS